MLEVSDRGEGVEGSKVLSDDWTLGAEGDEHDKSALAVSDVVHLSLGDSAEVGEGSGKVVVSHIVEGKVPEVEYGGAHFLGAVAVATAVA